MLEVVDYASDRAPLVVDRERVEHDPEEPAAVGKRAQLLVCDVPWMVVNRAASGMRDDHRRVTDSREDISKRRGRRMREVEDHAELDQPIDEPRAELRQPTGLGGAVRVGVAAVPRQRRHPDAQLPERVRRPHLVAELLDTLQRQEEADPLASLDGSEVGGGAHSNDAIRVLARCPQE